MSTEKGSRWFSDEGRHLDRFGLVLGLAAASVTILSLIDLDDATNDVRSEFAWILVTVVVGLTLVVSLRASGVARRPRRVAEIVVVLVILGVIAVTFIEIVADWDAVAGVSAQQPSPLWAFIAIMSPVVVLRRVMLHPVVTIQTIFGVLAVYLLLALAFNYAFLSIDAISSFFGRVESSSSFMYFSLTTITTVGYGDLVAVSNVGRFLASAEAILGQVLLVTVVARLVSTYSRSAHTSSVESGSKVSPNP